MRSRRSGNDHVAEVARRRLELLSAELAELRRDPDGSPWPEEGPGDGGATRADARRVPPGSEAAPIRPLEPPPPARTDAVPGRHAHRSVGVLGLVAGWLQDRLPAALQGRAQMSAAHVAVVAVLAVVGVAATAWWVSRADSEGTAVPSLTSAPAPGASPGAGASAEAVVPLVTPAAIPTAAPTAAVPPTPTAVGSGEGPTSPAGPGTQAAPGAAPSTSAGGGPPAAGAGSVVVDVTGKVRRPGIATLPTGSRVVDALEAAGGARRGVRLGTLNLARVLVDGEQVVVGVPAPPGVAASAASAPTTGAASPLVNINTASQSELEELPGVGPVTALAILDFRAENGAFTSVDELLEVSGIGDATLAELAPFVTL